MKKITLDQARETIMNAYGTIYSRADVLALLSHIEFGTSESIINITPEQYDKLAYSIVDKVVDGISNGGFINGYDFYLNQNEIIVDMIRLEKADIKETMLGVVNKWAISIKEDNDCGC